MLTWLIPILLAPGLAQAHDMWISPSDFAPQVGDLVAVQLRIGHAGSDDPMPRQEQRILRFSAVSPEGEIPLRGLEGRDPAGYWRVAEPGTYALLYESKAARSELTPSAFAKYLREEGLEKILELRRQQGVEDQPGRELYSRSLKSLVSGGGGEVARDQPRGLPLEFVLEDGHPPEDKPALRLLLRGEPLAGALVEIRAFDEAEPRFAGRSDEEGRIYPDLEAGTWIAAAVHMDPSRSPEADWESLFSTLTFTLTVKRPAETSPVETKP